MAEPTSDLDPQAVLIQGFTLTPQIIEKIQAQVTLPDQAALNAFVVDALNTYLQLGQLHQSGGKFVFEADGRETPIVLHFPFEARDSEAV